MIDLHIDSLQLETVAVDLQATDEELRKALRATGGRMATWLRTRAAKAVREETKLAAAIVRRRLKNLRFRAGEGGTLAGVWLGLLPVDLKYLNPRQNAEGVQAGPSGRRIETPGAFMGARPGRPAARLNGRAFKREGAARLPIVKQSYGIAEDAESGLEADVFDGFGAQFFKVFEHELKWQISKR